MNKIIFSLIISFSANAMQPIGLDLPNDLKQLIVTVPTHSNYSLEEKIKTIRALACINKTWNGVVNSPNTTQNLLNQASSSKLKSSSYPRNPKKSIKQANPTTMAIILGTKGSKE